MLTHTRLLGTTASTRCRISPAALFVNVIARMLKGRTPRPLKSQANSRRDDTGLATAGPGQDQERSVEMRNGVLLGGRQVGQHAGCPGPGHRKLSERGSSADCIGEPVV